MIRYTSSFGPPSAPFTSDGNTVALYHLDEGPVGACTGTLLDSSGASGGPSNGTCNYGGTDPAGPVYAADVPSIQDTSPPSISNVVASPLATEAMIHLGYGRARYKPDHVWRQPDAQSEHD